MLDATACEAELQKKESYNLTALFSGISPIVLLLHPLRLPSHTEPPLKEMTAAQLWPNAHTARPYRGFRMIGIWPAPLFVKIKTEP